MRKLKKSGRAKSVIQYGLDGVELRRFDSVSGAERETKVKRTNIIASIKNNGTAGGYKWRYVGKSVVIESEPKTNQREKPVWVYLKDDGSLIGHYSSQKSAAYSLDVCECNISKALNGFTQTFVVKIDGQKRKCFCTYHPMSEISTIGDMVSVPETLASDIVGSVDIMSSSEETSTPTTEILSTQEDTTTSLVEKTSISFDEESFINRTHGIYTTLLDGQTFSSEKAKKVIETISVIEGVDWKHVTEYIFSMLKKSEPDFIRECQTNFDWESICLNVDGPLKDYIKNNNVNDHFKELFDMMSMVYGWNVEEILSEYIIDVYGWDKVLLLLVSISESHLVVNIYDTTTTSIITTTTLSTPTSVVNTHSIPTNPFPPDDKVVLEETKRA